MERICYLDNSATTHICPSAQKAMLEVLEKSWGNPSSLHSLGIEAEKAMNKARKAVATALSCEKGEIVFTASGTEANNMAIFGAAQKGAKRGKRVVTTAVEHPSVALCFDQLEKQGFEVVRLKTDKFGIVSAEDIYAAVNSETILVSIMLVNNELGTIQPIKAAADAIKQNGAPALLHCDAVQAFGKMTVCPQKLGVDLLTASAHKIHGPKGVGILYIKKGLHIKPMILGGGQESGMRSGTEAVPLIYGMCGAIKDLPNTDRQLSMQQDLWSYAKEKLLSTGVVEINSPDNCLPYIINISVLGYRSETLLHFLESDGVYVSSGSACSKGVGSYVLISCGLSRQRVDSALRISFNRFNKKDDIDRLCDSLLKATAKLRKA